MFFNLLLSPLISLLLPVFFYTQKTLKSRLFFLRLSRSLTFSLFKSLTSDSHLFQSNRVQKKNPKIKLCPHEMANFVPDLSHLHDAFFQTDDKDEEIIIRALIEEFQAFSKWPLNFYKKGHAAKHLKPYALRALGKCVQHYDDEMESRRLQAEYNARYPVPQDYPPASAAPPVQEAGAIPVVDEVGVQEAVEDDVLEVQVEPAAIPVVDLVSETVEGGVVGEEEGEAEILQKVLQKGSSSRKNKGHGRKRKGQTIWVPSQIVCALSMPEVEPLSRRKGKEKVVDDGGGKKKGKRAEGVERLSLGGNERRPTGPNYVEESNLTHDYSDYVLHDILIEDEEKGWRRFKVVEDYDSGMDSGPDIPMSPPISEELDPNEHIFLLMRKGNSSSS